jgi:cell division protein FtsI (penicillin-binding protein 3)
MADGAARLTGPAAAGRDDATVEPTPGRDVYLTIDYDLQEIADAALREALERTRAAGGELLLTDPRTGEILAAVSRGGQRRARNWRAVMEPYEPGSTIKPFVVAALLRWSARAMRDSVYAEHGRYQQRPHADGRGQSRLADARPTRCASRRTSRSPRCRRGWTPAEQYRGLRDFGFGTPTGVSLPVGIGRPAAPAGALVGQSQASLAIGYEISVTPLQMAMAYGALANGGVLLEPRLVREVRSRDGRVERSTAPRAVRRVVPEDVAEDLRGCCARRSRGRHGRSAQLGPFASRARPARPHREWRPLPPGAYTPRSPASSRRRIRSSSSWSSSMSRGRVLRRRDGGPRDACDARGGAGGAQHAPRPRAMATAAVRRGARRRCRPSRLRR